MQFRIFLLLGVFCLCSMVTLAQSPATLSGQLKTAEGEPVPGASVKIHKTDIGAVTDENGSFQLRNVMPGNYTVSVMAVGYKREQKDVRVEAGRALRINFTLSSEQQNMEEVTVIGRTRVQEVNRQAFNVTAIDAKKLYNSTLDLSGALDRVSGVRVRQSGGVGSNFNLAINGFSGNRIRYFIDGVPMDNFGSSFQMNNIPINIAERVEVYKGVVPIWLGSDALGGAVNIVTGDRYRNYVDASYSYGSFNTHRSVLNTAFTSKKGLTFQLNAFQNYSDNDYKVTVDAADIYTGAYTRNAVVPRFHDTYHNETLIANAGVVGKKYADKLLFGMTLGQNYKELQTGARMVAVFGQWHRRGNLIMPTLRYSKKDLIKGLDVNVNANYNFGTEQNIDTASRQYDWYGTSKPNSSEGRGKSFARYRNNNGLVTSNASYRVSEHQTLALSNVFTTFNRKGTDRFNPSFTQGSTRPELQKNVLGLGYTYDVRDRWSTSVFGKYMHQGTTQTNVNKIGFGAAGSYFLLPGLQLKASYERANRLPEATELFGDVELVQGNQNLKPEQSDNINAGLSYGFGIKDNHRFLINASGIYRYSTNFIYSRFNQNQSALILDNLEGVFTLGGEGEVRYSYKNWLSVGTTVTYQYLQNQQQYVFNADGTTVESPVYLDQMPNIPYFFGNADATVTLRNLGRGKNTLNLGYNLLYVNEFWLYWPSLGSRNADSKFSVPTQISHDLNAVLSLKNGRYNIGLEARNITNDLLYDNFSLQKPGRGFYLNLRYFFNSFN